MANASRKLDERLVAIADPTRRRILERLAKAPSPVGVLADHFPISRPAISQHLRVLKDAGLVTETAQGTRRIYRVDPRGIGAMRDWLDQHWSRALESFKAFADADAGAGTEP